MNSKLLQTILSGRPAKKTGCLEILSDRELQIFRLIGEGKSTKKIASILNLSFKTVETHRENIKKKLNIKNVTDLLLHAATFIRSENVVYIAGA